MNIYLNHKRTRTSHRTICVNDARKLLNDHINSELNVYILCAYENDENIRSWWMIICSASKNKNCSTPKMHCPHKKENRILAEMIVDTIDSINPCRSSISRHTMSMPKLTLSHTSNLHQPFNQN